MARNRPMLAAGMRACTSNSVDGIRSPADGCSVVPLPTTSVVASWLLKAKVISPTPVAGYVPRAALLQRLDAVTERRFTALQAPAGFGKTTVLADFTRRKQEQGLLVGWISLDEDETLRVFGSYLAYAFECAGLDLSVLSDLDAWSSSPVTYQIGMVARAIEFHAAPCVLVLDEVDLLPRRTVALIERLVKRGPANLHFAMAFRSNPGLDLAALVFDGAGAVIGTEEFRFSRSEIDQFFQGALTRRQLAEVEEIAAGWPVALTVYRNLGAAGAGREADASRLTANFIGVRLLRDLSERDRAFLFDLAVFDWIDADLLEEVLELSDARLRIAALSSLDGLLLPIDQDGTVRRLHPLVREYCVDMLTVQDSERKQFLHARIARALAARGQATPAWRHASAAGDDRLVGELIEQAGLFEMWMRHGAMRVFSADRFLTPEIMALYPRLALLRCVALAMAVRSDEAAAAYRAFRQATDGGTRDRDGGDAQGLAIDHVFSQMALTGADAQAMHHRIDTLLPADGVVESDERGRFYLGTRHMLLCVSCYERGSLPESASHGARAHELYSEDMRYGNIVVDIYLGMAAMAGGRVRDACERYERARQETRRHFSSDPSLAVCADAVMLEIDLERNRERTIDRRTLKGLMELPGIWSDIRSVAVAVSAELTFERYDADAAVQLLVQTAEDVRAMRARALSNFVSALLVSYLVEVGRTERAARTWCEHELPDEVAELFDLDTHPWRTMEAMAWARARLLAAQGEFAPAAEIADGLCTTASTQGLTRTLLRGLALSMVIAERAGRTDRAVARLLEFLPLARDTGYVRPLVRDREVSRTVLRRLLDGMLDADTRDAAVSMLADLDGPTPAAPSFSPREVEVLVEVREGRRNREIADRLGISEEGVRFHLKNIYRKTGVSHRVDAVRNAQSFGVLD